MPFLHGHSHGKMPLDQVLETNERGIWALKVSLLGLLATALFQFVIVLASNSAGLLADTIHNAADALTAVPLWIAFVLAGPAIRDNGLRALWLLGGAAVIVIPTVLIARAKTEGGWRWRNGRDG